ncbi:hypothetical protein [Alloscardovia omnicolens]|nr:hypothetical protein [Alloscardovia omnicolens]MBS6347107.1 hypothetical protein [Alloscardovia omnicolens]MDK6643104.1 hypothetical protein [Alloscardovia omnicolens]
MVTQTKNIVDMPTVTENVPVDVDERSKQNLLILQAKRLVDLQDTIQSMELEAEQIKQQILDTHEPGTYPADGVKVIVKAGVRRLDSAKLQHDYPAAEHPDLYKVALDSKAVKAHFSPIELDKYKGEEGARSVVVK